MDTKVALVTGATSGIGAASARRLSEHGYTVYGVSRRRDRLEDLVPEGIRVFAMDLTSPESVADGVARVLGETGRIDLLVNNAGYGSLGSLEETPIQEGRRQFDVNVFGALQLTQLVLPHMRRQGSGRIVNVSSAGGKIYTPLGGWYHGTKFALEAMSDCLRLEVAQFGIEVVVVQPGPTDTEWGSIAADHVDQVSGHGPYARQAQAVAEGLRTQAPGQKRSAATDVADTIVRAATDRRPKTRYAVGLSARAAIGMRRVLPDRWFDAFITRASGVPRR
ncbi:oxidoreductase [Kineosporia mesophila]|uniref:Oxidoreductase n=1 Tax=Kineosporia mesophila TaxID=566012 RepID=A0ABP7ACS7_9ACTN